jgi:hypothetical protein
MGLSECLHAHSLLMHKQNDDHKYFILMVYVCILKIDTYNRICLVGLDIVPIAFEFRQDVNNILL